MKLLALACEGFRNLAPTRLEPHERFNVLEGRNGHGKTNLLEAIYLLASFRSFRDPRNVELVQWEQEEARLYGEVARREVVRKVELTISARGKRAKLDGSALTNVADYLGQFGVVFFGPDDLALTKHGPSARRRFLDRAIFNVWPAYLEEARTYQVALRNRNELLKRTAGSGSPMPDAEAVLASFDAELIRRGARVLWRRMSFLRSFGPLFAEIVGSVTGGELEATASYAGSVRTDEGSSEAELADALGEAIARKQDSDMRRGYTSVGPHVDDLEIELGRRSARTFASQGQHRALVLSLKMAELQHVRDVVGSYPVLLLDDVSSELDETRNAQLMSFLDEAGGQVFISTTDRRWIRLQGRCRVYEVERGAVRLREDA